MRDKPADADEQAWREFEAWADRNGIGDKPEDWGNWWFCWRAVHNVSRRIHKAG